MDIEQQLKVLEQRRKRGMRLLADGIWPGIVGVRRVTRSTGAVRGFQMGLAPDISRARFIILSIASRISSDVVMM